MNKPEIWNLQEKQKRDSIKIENIKRKIENLENELSNLEIKVQNRQRQINKLES